MPDSAARSRIQKLMQFHRFTSSAHGIWLYLLAYQESLGLSPELQQFLEEPTFRLAQQSCGLQLLVISWLAHMFSSSTRNEARLGGIAFCLQFATGAIVYIGEALQPNATSQEATAWRMATVYLLFAAAYAWGLMEGRRNNEKVPVLQPLPPLMKFALGCHAILGCCNAILSLVYPRGFYDIPIFLFGNDAISDPQNHAEMVMIQSWGSCILAASTVAFFAFQGKFPTVAFQLFRAFLALFAGLVLLYASYLQKDELHPVYFWGGLVVFLFMFLLYLLPLLVQAKRKTS